MAVTLEQVKRLLEADEPNHRAVARLGSEVIPHLETLARGPNEVLAARALYSASLINDPRAVNLLFSAATNPSVQIRIQVAAGARNLSQADGERILLRLLNDSTALVRIVGLKTVKAAFPSGQMPQRLAESVSRLRDSDPEEAVRDLSRSALQ
jgi:hypothetical protein